MVTVPLTKRRLPEVETLFLEDMANMRIPERSVSEAVSTLTKICDPKNLSDRVSRFQYIITIWLITSYIAQRPDVNAILVFVSGIFDIMELTEMLEPYHPRVTTCPIHSDIPFEEQLEAFKPLEAGSVIIYSLQSHDRVMNES